MKTQEDVINAISNVKHPAIDYSLLELGMVKDVKLDKNTVSLTFAFPFPNIPIADMLINSIAQPIKANDLDLDYKIVIMTEEEKAKFIRMENEAWKGGM